MSTLSIQNVSKIFPGHHAGDEPVQALMNNSFDIEKDEFCSILGHSGCGKTTMLNLIAGFEEPTEGQVLLDGQPIVGPSWERSVIFQDYALFPWMSVRDNVEFGLVMKKVPRAERDAIVVRHINLVGLEGFERRLPHQLSGGMRQRVAVALALAIAPRVLLMDEPFAALDAQNRSLMQREMVRIWNTERKTVVLVTHSIEEAIILSDRIIVMTKRPGRVKENIVMNIPRPRDEDAPDVIALRKHIRSLIEGEFDTEK